MPIEMQLKVEEGWKENENNRFGKCLVVRFIDTKSKKILFRYAPKIEEKEFWGMAFDNIIKLDALHKQAINLLCSIDTDFKPGKSEVCESG